MKTIGINIRITESDYSVWSNGLRQNIFILAQTFSLLGDYKVYIVNTGEKSIPMGPNLSWDTEKFKTVHYDDIKDDLDVYFVMGAEILTEQGYYLKKRGCRIVYYNCGNRYLIDMEDILFKGGKGKRQDPKPRSTRRAGRCTGCISRKRTSASWDTRCSSRDTSTSPRSSRRRPRPSSPRAARR